VYAVGERADGRRVVVLGGVGAAVAPGVAADDEQLVRQARALSPGCKTG